MSWDNVARSYLFKVPKLDRVGFAEIVGDRFSGYQVILGGHTLESYTAFGHASRLRNAVNLILKEYE